MTKKRTRPIQVRGPLGVVVELTPEEFDTAMGEEKRKVHTVKRRKCRFLAGVAAKYDADASNSRAGF